MTETTSTTGWLGQWCARLDELTAAAGASRATGTLQDVTITEGWIRGTVRTNRGPTQRPSAHWPAAPPQAWDRAIAAVAARLRHVAAIAERSIPDTLADELAAAGVALVPASDELRLDCTCPRAGGPCDHVVMLLEAAVARMRRAPELVLTLRGRPVERLVGRMRAHDGTGGPRAPSFDPTIPLEQERADIDQLRVQPRQVDDPTTFVRQLGPLPTVPSTQAVQELVGRAAADAWSLAIGAGADAADRTVVLTELRRQRFASAPAVATAVGWPEDRVRAVLDELFAQGEVLRTGSGGRARYRAAPGRRRRAMRIP